MPARLVKTGIVKRGIYRNKRMYEYGYTKEDHIPINEAHKKAMDEYLFKCQQSPKFAATVRPPSVTLPEVTDAELAAIEEQYLSKELVAIVKKHNGNYQFITNEPVKPEEVIQYDNENNVIAASKGYRCSKCERLFFSEKGAKIHAANCPGGN